MSVYLFTQMIIGMFFALSYIQRIWKKSVTTFIMTNMMFGFIVLHETGETEYGYALVIVCMTWMHYRAIFKPNDDLWMNHEIKIQLKDD